jgi:Stage II sporulation protein E (SpoIIE)
VFVRDGRSPEIPEELPPRTQTGERCGTIRRRRNAWHETCFDMSEDPDGNEREHRQLRREIVDQEREIRESDDRERRRDALITRLREEAAVREEDVAVLGECLEAAEHELEDLRAIRDALTPSELPQRPGLDLAAAFLPAEVVSGDFYLAAEGPRDSTVLVVGDVVGHGVKAARRAAFVRTAFAATAPFSDDPCQRSGGSERAQSRVGGDEPARQDLGPDPDPPGRADCRWGLGHLQDLSRHQPRRRGDRRRGRRSRLLPGTATGSALSPR